MQAITALVTDSTSNLGLELARQRGIYVVPLYIVWKNECLKDLVELSEPELFRRLATQSEIPTTSQASVQDFQVAFEKARAETGAESIVCGVISSALSGTYASAIQAARESAIPVQVVDTRQASWGLGFAMLAGAEARDNGASPDEIARAMKETAARSLLLFTIDSLEFLHRGGRIGNASRLLGTALNIKPVLTLENGIISPRDKVRTRRRAAIQVLQLAENHAAGRRVRRLAVLHGDCEDEGRELYERAVERLQPEESYMAYVTATLGVHTGPGALGIVVEPEG